MGYKEEQQELGQNFLDKYFSKWSEEGSDNWSRIEFMSTFSCALNCEYCYLNRYQDGLEPDDYDMSMLLERGKMLTDWLVKNNYQPDIDFFGGSPLIFDENIELLDYMIERLSNVPESQSDPPNITVPSSYIWIDDDQRTEKVEQLIKKAKKSGIKLYLSASVDGKYCDANRPTNFLDRDEEYYEKIFEFNKKYGFQYHPMIYSDHIEDWQDNFLWYVNKLREHSQSPDNIYLLEIRNPEWTPKQIAEYGDFIKFLHDWTWWYYSNDPERFFEFIFRDGFNTMRPFTSQGRGMGCSLQSTVMVQLADMSIKPCHRTAYPEFQLAHFEIQDGKIQDLVTDNPGLLIGHTVADQESFPVCEECPIKHLCNGGCIGAQYEETGSLYSPIPSVCQLEHEKMYSIYKWYQKHDLLKQLYARISEEFISDFKLISKMEESFNE